MKKTLMKKIPMKKTKYIIFLEKYNKFFRFGARKFYFPKYKKVLGFASSLVKYKKFFLEKIFFLRLGLGSSISWNIWNFFESFFFIFQTWVEKWPS